MVRPLLSSGVAAVCAVTVVAFVSVIVAMALLRAVISVRVPPLNTIALAVFTDEIVAVHDDADPVCEIVPR